MRDLLNPKADTLPQSTVLEELEAHAKRLLIEQMKLRELSYKELSALLERVGIYATAAGINRKVNRQAFQASFMLACLLAMNVEELNLRSVDVTPLARQQRLQRETRMKEAKARRRRRALRSDPE